MLQLCVVPLTATVMRIKATSIVSVEQRATLQLTARSVFVLGDRY